MEIIKLKLQRKLHCASLLRPLHSIHQRLRSENVVKNKYPNSGAQLFFSIGILYTVAASTSMEVIQRQTQQLIQFLLAESTTRSKSIFKAIVVQQLLPLVPDPLDRKPTKSTMHNYLFQLSHRFDNRPGTIYQRKFDQRLLKENKNKKKKYCKKKNPEKNESKLNTVKH